MRLTGGQWLAAVSQPSPDCPVILGGRRSAWLPAAGDTDRSVVEWRV